MLPYATGLMLDNASNYEIVKTQAVFVSQQNPKSFLNVSYNSTEPLEWLITPVSRDEESFQATKSPRTSRSLKPKKEKKNKKTKRKKTKHEKKLSKKNKRMGKKKCIVKFVDKNKRMKRRRRKSGVKMGKKLMIPLILGLMAAKSVLIPVAFKALAFISAKGFLMGFFSTILASFLSLKGMFDHSRSQRREDDKTQVEIIQVPAPPVKDEHLYYDHHYRRGDYVPGFLPVVP